MKKDYLSDSKLSDEAVDRASKACGPLFKWVRSKIEYAEILQQVQPLREEMAKLEEEGGVLEKRREELDVTIEVSKRSLLPSTIAN